MRRDARLVVRPTAKPSVMGTKMASAGEAKIWLGRVTEGMYGKIDIGVRWEFQDMVLENKGLLWSIYTL